MIRRLLALLSVPVCASAVVVLMPLGAQAQSAVTISLASRGTIARSHVLVTVPVQISCDLTAGQPGPIGTPFNIEGGATIAKAAGRAIATGTGFIDRSAIICDGAPHPNTITFVADSGSPPFHGGAATARLDLDFSDNFGNFESGSSGYQTVSLKG